MLKNLFPQITVFNDIIQLIKLLRTVLILLIFALTKITCRAGTLLTKLYNALLLAPAKLHRLQKEYFKNNLSTV